ncbi:MAG: polyprotein [Varroa dicistrovirus 1]|nr:MAG: polyprotein [Varroa dicistrovirus 1]
MVTTITKSNMAFYSENSSEMKYTRAQEVSDATGLETENRFNALPREKCRIRGEVSDYCPYNRKCIRIVQETLYRLGRDPMKGCPTWYRFEHVRSRSFGKERWIIVDEEAAKVEGSNENFLVSNVLGFCTMRRLHRQRQRLHDVLTEVALRAPLDRAGVDAGKSNDFTATIVAQRRWCARRDDPWYLKQKIFPEVIKNVPQMAVDEEEEVFYDAVDDWDVLIQGTAQSDDESVEPDCKSERKIQWQRTKNGRLTKKFKDERRQRVVAEKLVGKAQGWFDSIVTHKVDLPQNIGHDIHLPGIDKIAEALKGLNENVGWTGIIKEIGFFFSHLMVGGLTFKNVATSLAHLVTNLPLGKLQDKIEQMIEYVTEKFSGQAQAAEGAWQLISAVIAVVISIVGGLAFNALPKTQDVDRLINRFSRLGHLLTSFEKVTDVADKGSKLIVDFVKKTFCGYSAEDLDDMHVFNKYCDDVDAMRIPGIEAKLGLDSPHRQQLTDLIARGAALAKKVSELSIPPRALERFRGCAMFVEKLRQSAVNAPIGKLRSRVPPLALHVFGGTGVGKTNMLNSLCSHLLVELGCTKPEDLDNKVYFRDPGNKYFDGFVNGTEIVVYDDFGAVKDAIGSPNPEILEQIRVGNTAPFKPPMAELHDKSNAVFEAACVILTSNIPHPHIESLTNPEAIASRIHYRFEQTVAEEFRKTVTIEGQDRVMLDRAKVAEAAKTDPSAYRKAMRFQQVQVSDRQPHKYLTQPMDFETFATYCRERLREHRAQGVGTLEDKKGYFEEVAARGRAQAGLGVDPFVDEPVLRQQWTEMAREDAKAGYWFEKTWWQTLTLDWARHCKVKKTILSRFKATHLDAAKRMIDKVGSEVENERVAELFKAQCIRVHDQKYFDMVIDEMCVQMACFMWIGEYRETILLQMLDKGVISVCDDHMCAHGEADFKSFVSKWTERATRKWNYWWTPESYEQNPNTGEWIPNYTLKQHFFASVLQTLAFILLAVLLETFFRKLYQGVVNVGRWACGKVFSSVKEEPVEVNAMTTDKEFQRLVEQYPESGVQWVETMCSDAGQKIKAVVDMTQEEITRYLAGDFSFLQKTVNAEAYAAGAARAIKAGNVEAAREVIREIYAENYIGRPQGYTSGEAKAAGKTNVEGYASGAVKSGSKVNTESGENAQAFSDQNAIEVRDHVIRNLYSIWHSDDFTNDMRCIGMGVILRGRMMLTNRHILEQLKNCVMLVHGNNNRYLFTKEKCKSFFPSEGNSYSDRDVGLLECPETLPTHKNITKYFMTTEDFTLHSEFERGFLVGYTRSGANHAVNAPALKVNVLGQIRSVQKHQFELKMSNGVSKLVREYYLYDGQTNPGDCGSVLIANDTRVERKICGIHMAGVQCGSFTSAASAVHKGIIDDLMMQAEGKTQVSSMADGGVAHSLIDDSFQVDEEGLVTFQSPVPGEFVYLGRVPTRVFANTRTNIRPSPVADLCGPILKTPAKLAPFEHQGVRVDPMDLAMTKASSSPVCVDSKALRDATYGVQQMINNNIRESDCRTLTYEESIRGVEGDDCYPPINRSTSPGFGWQKAGKGKTKWLGDDEYVYDHPELTAKYDGALERVRRGERLGSFWTDTLKDELRPVEKVMQGKTRLFSCGEMIQTMLLRRFFGGFIAHLTRNCIRYESCVGLNVYSLQWTELAKRLQQVGDDVVAGDFSRYDTSLPAEVIWRVLDIVLNYYAQFEHDENDDTVRIVLWQEIVNSIHVNGDRVYMWTHGQPSGCPFTSILNSVAHSIVVRVVYLLCARKYAPEMATLASFDKYVRHNNYGDDDVTNVASCIVEWFNQITMSEMYATFGMEYTDELKTGQLVKTKKLNEIQFLKRQFRWDRTQSRFRAPLALDTIREMPCWNKTRTADQYELTALVLSDAVYELSHHPRDVFDIEMIKMENARKRISRFTPLTFDTYETLNEQDYIKYVAGTTNETVIGEDRQSQNANPQLLVPFTGLCQSGESVGELFSSIDRCVPTTTNNRRPILRARRRRLGDPSSEEQPPATNTNKSDFSKFIDGFTTVTDKFSRVCDKSANGWSPTDLMVDNTARSLYRAGNAIENLMTVPGRRTRSVELSRLKGFAKLNQNLAEKFRYLATKYSECMNKRATGWSPIQFMIDNATRSLTRANNSLDTLLHSAGGCKSGILDRKIEDPVQEALSLSFLDDVHCLPEGFVDPDPVDTVLSGVAEAGIDEPLSTENFAGEEQETVERIQLVKLVEDGQVTKEDRDVSRSVPRSLEVGAADQLTNDVKGFLSRPVPLRSFEWKKTDGIGTELTHIDFPYEWMTTMMKEKLAGFRYLRCTFVVELQVNAQPFNAGALLAWFNPLRRQLQSAPSYTAHLAGKMGCPNVVYRCNEATAVRIKIPFFPTISHYDLLEQFGTAGTLSIEVLSGLTGADDCDATVWVWAEDVDIQMPSGAPISGTAQSGSVTETLNATKDIISMARSLPGASLIDKVPMVSQFADAAETAIGAVANITGAFGWSKPIQPNVTDNVQQSHVRFMANSNGPSDARVLALDSKNATKIPTDVFNTEEDEMAFATIIKRPSYFGRFTFKKGDKQGAILTEFPADPCHCQTTIEKQDSGEYLVRYETYLSYLSQCAAFWRGSLKYRLMLMKTPFHSGRIRVTFIPGGEPGQQVDLEKCYSEVHDVRGRMDIEFNVPYSFNQPWRPTNMGKGSTKSVTTRPQGYVRVTVLNALRGPSTVADSIEILCFVSAGEDFQFSIPYNTTDCAILHYAASVPAQPTLSGVAQSGEEIYPSSDQKDTCVNTLGVGEVFTGFRQWLKRFNARAYMGNHPFQFINPHDEPSDVDYKKRLESRTSPTERAVMLYRFRTGSIRLLVDIPATEKSSSILIAYYPEVLPNMPDTDRVSEQGLPMVLIPKMDFPCEVAFPFYQLWPALPTDVGNPKSSRPGEENPDGFRVMPYNLGGVFRADPADLRAGHVAIGEDFSMGYLLGPPVCITKTS